MADAAMRADAARNRLRLLEAAQAVFDEHGVDAPTSAVAARAGVGVGTLFRHFPTKDDLLAAVLTRHLDGIAERAEALSDATDPGAAFFDLLAWIIAGSTQKNRFVAALRASGNSTPQLPSATRRRFRAALGRLLTRAQQAGAVRTDVDVALVVGVVRAAAAAQSSDRSQRRTAVVILDALRPH